MSHSPVLDLARAGELAAQTRGCVESDATREAVASIRERRGPGSDFLGWLDLPERSLRELDPLLAAARELREEVDTLVVVGIGGSYLGTRAVLDALKWKLWTQRGVRVLYAGHHLEATGFEQLADELQGHDFAINMISKSGTTTEPAIAFRLLRQLMLDRFGADSSRSRIVATTDSSRGALRALADREGYRSFVVPDDVGGRFSVLSPVGLYPLAVAGVDVRVLLEGARAQMLEALESESSSVSAVEYAAYRHCAYEAGHLVEVLASFHPSLHHLSEWWKQLYGESEGKEGKGIFPASVEYTTDLHSLGQAMQDGTRHLMETFLQPQEALAGPRIPSDPADPDGLEYLAGRQLGDINADALAAVADAHVDGGIPVATIAIEDLSEAALGGLLAFFEFACAVSGRLLGVNPFDQPGVEAYKVNLFRRLGRPGY